MIDQLQAVTTILKTWFFFLRFSTIVVVVAVAAAAGTYGPRIFFLSCFFFPLLLKAI